MLEIDANLEILFDAKLLNRTIDRVMGQIIREAAREWLRAILKSVPSRGGFPVLTGASKSTLVPLGRFLKQVKGLEVTPVYDGKHPFQDRRAEGEASQEFQITKVPREGRDHPDGHYNFAWANDVLHYYINEFFPIIKSAPWHTLEAGQAAFEASIEEAISRRLPNIADYIYWKVRSTDG